MTGFRDDVWTLCRRDDGALLAELPVTDGGFPWLYARVEAHPGLAEMLPLFAEELRLLEDDVNAWERAYDAVERAVVLRYPDGAEVPEFLLHLNGDEAWWRWSDEPFDDPAPSPSPTS